MKLNISLPNLIFLEYNSKVISDTYVFQDLSVDFVARFISEHPEMRKYVGCIPADTISQGINGYLIDRDEVDELYIAMEKLLLEGEKIKTYIAENRKNYIEQYSWESIARRIVKVFEIII